jgi:hypothetical protein
MILIFGVLTPLSKIFQVKLLDLSNAFLVEYFLTAIPDISTSVLKQKKYITDMCSCYTIAWLCKFLIFIYAL